MELSESKLGIWLELWLWLRPDARSSGFVVFGKIELLFEIAIIPLHCTHVPVPFPLDIW